MRALVVAVGGGAGDTFLATVVARALRQKYDEVDMLALPAHRAILRGNPDIAHVVEDASPRALRTRKYDAAVCTWATFPNARLMFAAGIPVRVGQARRLYSWLFTKRVVVRSELGDHASHWTQILLDYARAIGCDTSDAQPRLTLDDADRAAATELLEKARVSGPFGLLHPTRGITSNRERWPSLPFAQAANELVDRFGIPLLITGSNDDRPLTKQILAQARAEFPEGGRARRGPVINIAGSTSLRTFTALAERARFVAAMDSGPMHLAASTGTPTLGIFALQSDEPQRWAPLGERAAVLRGTYPCPPDHRKETCPDFACVRALRANAVVDAVESLP